MAHSTANVGVLGLGSVVPYCTGPTKGERSGAAGREITEAASTEATGFPVAKARMTAHDQVSELNDPNGIPNELDEPPNIGGTDGRSCAEFGPATPEIIGNEDLARSSAL